MTNNNDSLVTGFAGPCLWDQQVLLNTMLITGLSTHYCKSCAHVNYVLGDVP